ncbi:MAG TPA: peroxide stress protein YaaA [Flavobacterium sp.]|nr:peroxide stress protein YaaA [Flavobacterium sp.]
MKIVISPAKTLEYERELPVQQFSQPAFLSQSRKVHKVLKQQKPSDLIDLMDISSKLADLNWKRNKEWKTPFTPDNARQAIFAFNGDVYVGLDAYTIAPEKFEVLQQKLRILSGLYGLVKPLDLIRPYRLEMGTKLPVGDAANLYEFWRQPITKALNAEMKKGELLVNLASKEYFSAIDTTKLKVTIVTPEFKDYSKGKLQMISFYAKKARGMMVRYIIESGAETVDGLKGFNYEGYGLDSNLSTATNLVFTR